MNKAKQKAQILSNEDGLLTFKCCWTDCTRICLIQAILWGTKLCCLPNANLISQLHHPVPSGTLCCSKRWLCWVSPVREGGTGEHGTAEKSMGKSGHKVREKIFYFKTHWSVRPPAEFRLLKLCKGLNPSQKPLFLFSGLLAFGNLCNCSWWQATLLSAEIFAEAAVQESAELLQLLYFHNH